MKIKLPIVGEVRTGKDVVIKETPTITTLEDGNRAEKIVDILGGILDNDKTRLSNEKTISHRLLAANKEWIYRNNDVIAKEVAQIEFVLYSMGLKDGSITYKEIDSHPLLDLLDRFNGATTTSDGIYNTQSHKKLTGDAFWLLDKNGSTIRNIFVLPPDKIELKLGDPTDASDELVEGYEYKDVIDGKKIKRDYNVDEVIHFKTPNPNNMFRGYGAVEAAADTIDVDNLTNFTSRQFFEKGAITNFVLSTDSQITEEQLKRLRAELRAAYGGVQNAYKTMILGGGLKPTSITMSNREMEFLKQLEWYRDKIMVIFGNTKASLGIIDDVNRASHESSIIAWKRNSVKPEMQAIVDTLNEFLVPLYGDKLVLGFKDPVPEDRDSKLEEIEKAKDILSINERRTLLGYDVIPEGNVIPEVRRNENGEAMLNNLEVTKPDAKKGLPEGLKGINMTRVLRRNGFYERVKLNKEIKDAALPLAKALITKRRKKNQPTEAEPVVQESEQYSNETVWTYWGKQIHIVDQFEKRFEGTVVNWLTFFEKEVLANLEEELAKSKKVSQKALVDEEQLVVRAELDFMPLLMEQIIISGQQAYKLLDIDDPYIPFAIRDAVLANVRKFTGSMIDTDRKKLAKIIADGIKEGHSVPQIRSAIQDAFSQFKKNQAGLITRTEVIKASNMAALDAFEQSGVVIGKQWLTAEDDRVDTVLCAPLNGKIIPLRGKFFKKGEEFNGHKFDYESIKMPPLHPGCRCVLLPVLSDQKGFEPETISERALLVDKIKALEEAVDKTTKAYEKLQKEKGDDKAYIKGLEALLGEENED